MLQFAKEGYPFIITFAAFTAVSALLRIHWLTGLFLLLTLFMFYFFRDPDRVTPPDRKTFYSPADGKIIVISEAVEEEILKDKALKISIFMSPLNVHVNRAPCDGIVKDVKYYPGKFFNAYTDEASIKNEHITMLLESKHGKVVVKQIAGSVARRAVCRVKPGEVLKQGQRYGIIKFSSRLDVFLPLNTKVKVQLNDKVKAGETVLGVVQ
ncbi:MAG: phosphatidylserine decarboxylase family protein [Nitrospiraceae bacterium]|nr:MAG: phosphatidylserine decarboxylase family protein [Nitrospiraceae bacterium]